jgi:alpha-galactosidase
MPIPEPEHCTTKDPVVAIRSDSGLESPPMGGAARQAFAFSVRRISQVLSCGVLVLLTVSWHRHDTVQGWWKTTRTLKDGTLRPVLFEFKVARERLSGTARFDWGDLAIQNGILKDDRLSFSVGSMFHFTGASNLQGIELSFHDDRGSDQTLRLSATDETILQLPTDRPPLPALRTLPASPVIASKPPMGWNSWNYFHKQISDPIIRGVADAIASNGMKQAGYTYIVIDDGWQGHRDSEGRLQPNEKFPNMRSLADYVHARGLKLGLYSSPGSQSCGKLEGSYRHEEQDAATFAAWGIDFLKYDWCSASHLYRPSESRAVFQKMGSALQATGRPILLSLSQYGIEDVWLWGADAGASMWRTTGDIQPAFRSVHQNALDQQIAAVSAGPGRWNDPDMLEVGNGGMTEIDSQSNFNLWAMLAAPLIAGNDVRNMTASTQNILLNRNVIAIDQDPLGKQATLTSRRGDIEIWQRPLSNGDKAVMVLNISENRRQFQAGWKDLGLATKTRFVDVWSAKQADTANSLKVELQPHESRIFRVF